jgi:multiple sugar transport system substrate-binding protein
MFIMGSAFLTGCGKGGEAGNSAGSDPQPAKERVIDTTPVTLKFAVHLPMNEEFNKLYIEPVQKKYPHITLDLVSANSFKAYDQLIAGGETPDLYISFNGNMPGLKDRGINMDMKPLFQQYNIDLNRFEQNYLDDIQYSVTEKGELYGLPLETGFHALYYNKAIFDKFGVPYPSDGMTMEDAMELAKKLTRQVDGVQYRGWDIGSVVRMAQPLGLEYIDHATEKPIMSSEGWKRVFTLVKQIYSIPGNEPSKDSNLNRLNGFMNGTIAMLNETNIFSRLKEAELQKGLQWDVAQHPFYKDVPNTFGNATVYMVGVTPTSKYKEQALLVMEVLTSDEVQMNVSKAGRVSPLKNEDIKKAFASGDPVLASKRLTSILKSKPVRYPRYLYREIAEPMTTKKFDAFLKGTDDVNTVLRQLDEEIARAVESATQ